MAYRYRLGLNILVFLFLVVFIFFAFPNIARSEKLDLDSQTILIHKVEATLFKLKPTDKTVDQLGLKAQLANLYAEQARLLLIEEGKRDCELCLGSRKVRQKAVGLYKEVLPSLNGEFRARTAMQLAHLHEMLGDSQAAIILYDSIVMDTKNEISKAILGKALVNRGNGYFRQGKFIPALKDFKDSLELVVLEEKGSVLSKIAWTHYNQGEISTAILEMKSLLSQKKYLVQVSSQGTAYSESLQVEFAHDLALFMAKSEQLSKNGDDEIKQLIKLTPESAQIDILLFLADECDRLDNAAEATRVWQYALNLPQFPIEKKPTVRIKIAKFFREKHLFERAFKEFVRAFQEQLKCKPEVCIEFQAMAKNYLTSWDKLIKSRSSTVNTESALALLSSYQEYNRFYSSEVETLVWQAQLARDIGRKQMALESYYDAAELAADQKLVKLTEESVLAEIALAESGNSNELKMRAYDHYIFLAPQGAQIWPVKFAKANLFYDLKKYSEASDIFRLIGHLSDKECNCKNKVTSITLKAAHLELDSLAKMGESEKIEIAAKEYAMNYPKDRMIFFRISRKAGMKQIFYLVNSKDDQDLISANKKVNSLAMTGATNEEKTALYKIKMELAELNLNFDLAYRMSLVLGMHQSKNSNDLVKVLVLAELSKHNTTILVEKIISSKAPLAVKRIAYIVKIRNADNPWPLIGKYSSFFKADTAVFADLLIEAFNKTKNFNEVEKYTTNTSIIRTSSGLTLWRLVFLKKLGAAAKNIQTVKLVASSDKKLASTFKNRLNLLKDLQIRVKKADQMSDWSAQVISRSIFRAENISMANEIQKLPVPKSLRGVERQQYQNGLIMQSKPFVNEAVAVSKMLDNLWQDHQALDALVNDLKNQIQYRALFVSEARAVASYAPDSVKSVLIDALADLPDTTAPLPDKMMVAYLEIRRQNLAKNSLQEEEK